MQQHEYAVFLGLDVGKEEHHACGLDPDGARVHDKALSQSEARIRETLESLAGRGPVLVVVDQPASIGALAVTVARSLSIDVAYLPGLAIRPIADLHPGNAKTDTRDAYVNAEAARSTPHALRRVDTGNEALADLEVIVGFDDDLTGEVTRTSNRIRGLLTQVHPALERVLGPKVQHPTVIKLPTRFGGPQGLAKATRRQLVTATKTWAPRSYEKLDDQLAKALSKQTVTVPGTRAAELVLPHLATTLAGLLAQRPQAAKQIEEMHDTHPLSHAPTSMPGIGIEDRRTHPPRSRRWLRVLDQRPPSRLHRLAPVTRRSSTSIRGKHPSRAGNKQLKQAFFLTAFASLSDPTSRAYYHQKRTAGKKHNTALIRLARQRTDVLHAMLRHDTPLQDPQTQVTAHHSLTKPAETPPPQSVAATHH